MALYVRQRLRHGLFEIFSGSFLEGGRYLHPMTRRPAMTTPNFAQEVDAIVADQWDAIADVFS